MTNINGLSQLPASGYAHDMHVYGEYFDSFEALAQFAGQKLSRGHQKNLFYRYDWLESLHRHCLNDRAMRAYYVEAMDSKAHVWLFLAGTKFPGRFGPLANFYSFVAGPAFGGDYDEITKLALLRKMAAMAAKGGHKIALDNVPDENGEATLMRRAFRLTGWHMRHEQCDVNHILHVNGRNFDEYWRGRAGQMRSTVRRKARAHGIDTRIDTVLNKENWQDYQRVYQRSWKPNEASPEFLKELALRESDAGALRLGLAYKDGQAVAAQLWTVDHGIALIHKLAYDEAEKKSSAGTILSAALFQHVIDNDKVDLVDFGTGDDPYKAGWMEETRPRYRQVYYWPQSPLSWPDLAWHGARRIISGLVDKSLND